MSMSSRCRCRCCCHWRIFFSPSSFGLVDLLFWPSYFVAVSSSPSSLAIFYLCLYLFVCMCKYFIFPWFLLYLSEPRPDKTQFQLTRTEAGSPASPDHQSNQQPTTDNRHFCVLWWEIKVSHVAYEQCAVRLSSASGARKHVIATPSQPKNQK